MRRVRLVLTASALSLLAACGSDTTAPVRAEGAARHNGGYITSGNRDGTSGTTMSQPAPSDTTTRIGGYIGSGN